MENGVKRILMKIGERVIKGLIPVCDKVYDSVTEQTIVIVPGYSRRLVIDPDGAMNWYNFDGPEA